MILLVYVTTGQDRTASPSITESDTAGIIDGPSCENPVSWREARNFMDRHAAFIGTVAGIRYRQDVSGQPTWINIGADFPEPDRLVLVVWGRNRQALLGRLDGLRAGQTVCASGRVSEYQGVPQIEVEIASQIQELD